jgi:tetratricopeptide (TPR) repeat protein
MPFIARANLGLLYLIQGDLEHALRVLEQGLALCRAAGERGVLPTITAGLGSASALQGRLTEGRALLEEAISESIRTGRLRDHANLVAWLGEVCRLAGRGDSRQAERLEEWLEALLSEYRDFVLDIDTDIAQLWGRLRVPHPENALDKQIAATALIHGLTVVTRNQANFRKTGVRVLNPFIE